MTSGPRRRRLLRLRNDNQELERAVQSGWGDTGKVVPHDWGGWSTPQVTAVTADGFRVRAQLLPGVFRFTDATGIRTRHELRESEMPAGRLMNRIRSAQSPRSADALQSGLLLELVEAGDASVAMTSRDTGSAAGRRTSTASPSTRICWSLAAKPSCGPSWRPSCRPAAACLTTRRATTTS